MPSENLRETFRETGCIINYGTRKKGRGKDRGKPSV